MSRKGRQGRRQPTTPPRQDALSRRLVALPASTGASVVQLADGTTGTSGRIIHQASAQSTNAALSNQSTSSPWSQPTGRPYPPMEKISPDKPLLKSLGATGTAIFSGIITSEEYNSDFYWKDAIQVYEQMIRNDAQIFAMTQLLELPIRRATPSIEPASDQPRDKEIASFVESCLFHDMRYTTSEGRVLSQNWDDTLRHILMMLRFGFMAFEKVFRIEDGWVKWARWTPLLPRTIWRWWVGEDNELVGVQQWTFKNYTYQFIDIPADKLLMFTHRREGNNYEGVSVLRSAYKHWYYKDNFYKIEAIDIERNAAEIPAIYLPENYTQDDLKNAQSVLANMRVNEQMGVTMPPGWKVEYIRTYGRNTASVQPSIQHHDIMIARNILGQFLNLGSSETGSYALAQEQTATFLAALQAECEYIEDVINNEAIPELVNYNYAGVETYPKLKFSKVLAQDFDAIADALNKLTSAPSGPLIHGDAELEDFLRNELGLPQAPKSAVEATNPTAPSTPERPETGAAHEATGDGDHADQESATVQPSAQQEATSQAIANGAPNANTQSGQVQESGTAASGEAAADALATEARLLREAIDAAYGNDIVEAGLVFGGHQPGYTQNRGPHGRWGPGDGGEHESGGGGVHAPHGISAEHGVHERGSGGGSGGARGGGRGAKAVKAPKETDEARLSRLQATHAQAKAARDLARTQLRAAIQSEESARFRRTMATKEKEKAAAQEEFRAAQTQHHVADAGHMFARKAEGEARLALNTELARQANAREDIHARSARLQREQGLAPEAHPTRGDATMRHAPGSPEFNSARDTLAARLEPAGGEFGMGMLGISIAAHYGEDQLGAYLAHARAGPRGYSLSALHTMQDELHIPRSSTKAKAVSDITAHITEGRYSANFGAKAAKGEGAAKGSRSRSGKSEEERGAAAQKATVDRAQARVDAAEAAFRAEQASYEARGMPIHIGSASHELGKAQGELAKAEGRELFPGERGIPRSAYLEHGGVVVKGFHITTISPEQAREYVAHPERFPRTGKSPSSSARATGGKSAREQELERQVASLKAERDALKARTETKATSRVSARAQREAAQRAVRALKPVGSVEGVRLDPALPLSAYRIHQIYGSHQLRTALSQFSLSRLRDAVPEVQAQHPNTKPTNLSSAKSVTDYLVKYIAGDGY